MKKEVKNYDPVTGLPVEYIDMGHQMMYSEKSFREDLMKLRSLIRDLGLTASPNMDVADYEERQVVLNWLIEDVELRFDRHE